MTQIDPNTVPAFEAGITRLYTLDLPADEVDVFRDNAINDDGTYTGPVIDALGAQSVDMDYVDIFDVSHMDGIGLTGFLTEGNGISAETLAPYRERLAALSGHVMVVYSQAFGNTAQTLNPKPPLRFVAAFAEDSPDIQFEPLPDAGAKGIITDAPAKKKPSDAAMGGRVATIALIVMALLVWGIIKIAG